MKSPSRADGDTPVDDAVPPMAEVKTARLEELFGGPRQEPAKAPDPAATTARLERLLGPAHVAPAAGTAPGASDLSSTPARSTPSPLRRP